MSIFITFEGGEGVGKSTQIQLLADKLRGLRKDVVTLRDPGSSAVGEQIRALILDPSNDGILDKAELLLYEAARVQLVDELIKPALSGGKVVLCDRFADSTIAYQQYGRGLQADYVASANTLGMDELMPTRTLYLARETPVSTQELSNMSSRKLQNKELDRIELAGTEFHEAVIAGFAQIEQSEPSRFIRIDVQDDKAETAELVWQAVSDLF